MKFTRRSYLSAAAGASALSAMPPALAAQPPLALSPSTLDAQGLALEEAAAKPVLRLKGLNAPVIIESIELLLKGREHFLRIRSKGPALQARSSTTPVLRPCRPESVLTFDAFAQTARTGEDAKSDSRPPPRRQEIEPANVHAHALVHASVNMPALVNIQSDGQAVLEKMLAEQLRQLLGRIPWLSGAQVAASVIQPLSGLVTIPDDSPGSNRPGVEAGRFDPGLNYTIPSGFLVTSEAS